MFTEKEDRHQPWMMMMNMTMRVLSFKELIYSLAKRDGMKETIS